MWKKTFQEQLKKRPFLFFLSDLIIFRWFYNFKLMFFKLQRRIQSATKMHYSDFRKKKKKKERVFVDMEELPRYWCSVLTLCTARSSFIARQGFLSMWCLSEDMKSFPKQQCTLKVRILGFQRQLMFRNTLRVNLKVKIVPAPKLLLEMNTWRIAEVRNCI